jgi:hypothetical protein
MVTVELYYINKPYLMCINIFIDVDNCNKFINNIVFINFTKHNL